MKTEKREEARRIRREQGLSVREIAGRLGVSVGSVSLWVRDVALTEEQRNVLLAKNPALNGQLKGAKKRKDDAFDVRKSWQRDGEGMAAKKDVEFIAGCMLYWAEGDKSRNVVGLSNTDKNMLRFFVAFLRKWFGVTNDEFTLKVQWYSNSGNTVEEIQKYWTDMLGLPLSCVRKFQVDNISKYSQKKKGNKHPYGTCCVRVCRTDIVQKIYGAIQGFAGFTSATWI